MVTSSTGVSEKGGNEMAYKKRMKSGRTFRKTARRVHKMNRVPRGGFRI